jgi:ankyrin repeat protein
MILEAIKQKWKWLRDQPLSRSERARLELVFAVVVTTAATVGLSTVIHPDPSKLASRISVHAPHQPEAKRELRAPPVPRDFSEAVSRGDLATMNRLYKPGMTLDGMLSIAVSANRRPIVLWLLDHGADVHEFEDTVNAPLLMADDYPAISSLLLDRGAMDPSLATAAEAGAVGSVSRLLARHEAVNTVDGSPLVAAVLSRQTAETKRVIVDKLLAAGADPNRISDGASPLAAAVRACDAMASEASGDCRTIIFLLVRHGARVKGDALVAAFERDETIRDDVLAAVLSAPLERGATAVALAEPSADPRAIKLLASRGVDWAWHDGEDDAALPVLAAVRRGDRDYVRALLDVGAPVDARYKAGTCALGEAIDGAAHGAAYARIVELLLARGADVNRRLPDGRTPLFAAAESGDIRVLNALLERGALVNELVLNDTALDAAEQNGNQPAARILHAHGARRAPDRTIVRE